MKRRDQTAVLPPSTASFAPWMKLARSVNRFGDFPQPWPDGQRALERPIAQALHQRSSFPIVSKISCVASSRSLAMLTAIRRLV
jgi:hypothetical protein